MAVNAALNRHLECAICLDVLRDPRTLPCQHTFCKRCLAGMIRSKYLKKDGNLQLPVFATSIVCPSCNAHSQEFRNLDELDKSHIISDLLEAQAIDRGELKSPSYYCMCRKIAKISCYRCSGHFCVDCYKKQLGKPCSAEKGGLAGFMQSVVVKHIFVRIPSKEDDCDCIEHSLPLDLFCSDCKQAICMDCFLKNHNGHHTKSITYARGEAFTLIDKIKIIRSENKEEYDSLYQCAFNLSSNATADEIELIDEIEDIESRIHGLIASLFRKVKLFCHHNAGVKKSTAESAMSLYDSSKGKHSTYNFENISDFELACLMNDLLTVKERAQVEAKTLNKKIDAVMQLNFEHSQRVFINEDVMFDSILSSFEHVDLGKGNAAEFFSEDFNVKDYLDGKYLNDNAES